MNIKKKDVTIIFVDKNGNVSFDDGFVGPSERFPNAKVGQKWRVVVDMDTNTFLYAAYVNG